MIIHLAVYYSLMMAQYQLYLYYILFYHHAYRLKSMWYYSIMSI